GSYTTALYFYNDDIRNRILEKQEIENDMQRGIDHEEFMVYIQPKYSLKTLSIKSGEALVRWKHPKKDIIPPDMFIPLFEENGFIVQLDMYMLKKVCKQLRTWIDSGKTPVSISVNQSRLHLHNPNYLRTIIQILETYQISPKWIELEITESAFFEDTEKMIEILNSLHEAGFKISMDDFGSGYSSLNMLQEITVDVLKIDKNFFKDSSNSDRGKKIVDNIITMASDLDIVVVAEGVETKEQVEFLKKTDCDLVQGYFFSKPLPMDEFEKKLFNE
ncbi:MAG: EAL domain-containing protein, partial [Eubacterium sp.]